MSSAVFCEACLAIYLRVKLFTCVRINRCPRDGSPAVESGFIVPPQKLVELLASSENEQKERNAQGSR